MERVYKTKGTCSKSITIKLDGDVIKEVSFSGGCSGNLMGMSKLLIGRPVDEVIELLEGTDCEGKGTSCPDQLSKALKEMKAEQNA